MTISGQRTLEDQEVAIDRIMSKNHGKSGIL